MRESDEDAERRRCGVIEKYWRGQGFPTIVAKPILRELRFRNGNVGFWGIASNVGERGLPPAAPP